MKKPDDEVIEVEYLPPSETKSDSPSEELEKFEEILDPVRVGSDVANLLFPEKPLARVVGALLGRYVLTDFFESTKRAMRKGSKRQRSRRKRQRIA